MIYRGLKHHSNKVERIVKRLKSGSEFISCDFSQPNPGTFILQGKTDLTFINCNLNNCLLPKKSRRIFILVNARFDDPVKAVLRKHGAIVQNGDEFHNCNFSQKTQDTEIFKGLRGLVFSRCNLINCKIQSSARVMKSCNTAKMDLCYHLVEGLPEEPDNCRHVTRVIPGVVIDGEVIVPDTYERKHIPKGKSLLVKSERDLKTYG